MYVLGLSATPDSVPLADDMTDGVQYQKLANHGLLTLSCYVVVQELASRHTTGNIYSLWAMVV
jgi:hypothetical protein